MVATKEIRRKEKIQKTYTFDEYLRREENPIYGASKPKKTQPNPFFYGR